MGLLDEQADELGLAGGDVVYGVAAALHLGQKLHETGGTVEVHAGRAAAHEVAEAGAGAQVDDGYFLFGLGLGAKGERGGDAGGEDLDVLRDGVVHAQAGDGGMEAANEDGLDGAPGLLEGHEVVDVAMVDALRVLAPLVDGIAEHGDGAEVRDIVAVKTFAGVPHGAVAILDDAVGMCFVEECGDVVLAIPEEDDWIEAVALEGVDLRGEDPGVVGDPEGLLGEQRDDGRALAPPASGLLEGFVTLDGCEGVIFAGGVVEAGVGDLDGRLNVAGGVEVVNEGVVEETVDIRLAVGDPVFGDLGVGGDEFGVDEIGLAGAGVEREDAACGILRSGGLKEVAKRSGLRGGHVEDKVDGAGGYGATLRGRIADDLVRTGEDGGIADARRELGKHGLRAIPYPDVRDA